MAAFSACPAGIFRVNNLDPNTSKLRLVFDKAAELEESPSRHLGSLRLAKPCPIPDTLQFFEGNSFVGVFGLRNKLFAGGVVYVPAEALLFAANRFELAPDVLRALALLLFGGSGFLQGTALVMELLSDIFNLVSTVSLPGVRGGDICDTQIHADEICGRRGRPIGHIHGYEQEPLAVFSENEVGLPFGVGKTFLLVFAHHERDYHPALKRQETDTIHALEAHQALVVWDAGVWPELRALLPVTLISFDYLSNAAYRHLCGKIESRTQVLIVEFLQRKLVCQFTFERLTSKPVGSFVESLHRRSELIGLLGVGQKLCLKR